MHRTLWTHKPHRATAAAHAGPSQPVGIALGARGGQLRRGQAGIFHRLHRQLVEHLERLAAARHPRRLRLLALGLWRLLLGSSGSSGIGIGGGGGGGSGVGARRCWLARRAEESRE